MGALMCNDMFPGLNSMQGIFETLTMSSGVLLEIISVFILCFQVFTFIILLQCGRLIRAVQEQLRDGMIAERG